MKACARKPQFYRWYVLTILLLGNVLSQWDRYILGYLSSATVSACDTPCKGVSQSICEACPAGDVACVVCHGCLHDHGQKRVNVQGARVTCMYGVCLPSACGMPAWSRAFCGVGRSVVLKRVSRSAPPPPPPPPTLRLPCPCTPPPPPSPPPPFLAADGTCLSGVEYGVLTGIAFLVVYAVFALLLAPLPDRMNKRNLLAAGVLVWSLASAVRRCLD
jgi:hypothetical protein